MTPDLVFVLPDLCLGGAQRVATHLIERWVSAGQRVCVITLGTVESDFFPLPAGAARIALGMQAPTHSLFAAVVENLRRVHKLRAAIRGTGARTVLSFVAGTNVLALFATRGLGLRVVVSERNDPARQPIGRVWALLRRASYGWADVVTANSAGAVATLSAFVPRGRLRFIPNGVALAQSPAPREPVFLAVGRLSHQKGFDVLLEAFALASPKLAGWRLIVLGEGELRAILADQARRLGIEGLVEMPGAVADPAAYYARAAVFVLSSRFEGTPNALLEALASGTPAIVTDTVSIAAGLVASGAALLVPAGSAVALSDALCEFAANPPLRNRAAAAAVASVQDQSLDSVLVLWNQALEI